MRSGTVWAAATTLGCYGLHCALNSIRPDGIEVTQTNSLAGEPSSLLCSHLKSTTHAYSMHRMLVGCQQAGSRPTVRLCSHASGIMWLAAVVLRATRLGSFRSRRAFPSRHAPRRIRGALRSLRHSAQGARNARTALDATFLCSADVPLVHCRLLYRGSSVTSCFFAVYSYES